MTLAVLLALVSVLLWRGASEQAAGAASSKFTAVSLAVLPGNGASPFNVPRQLTIPKGWAAEVWARIPDARFAVWTPQHALLVSSPASGQILELQPGGKGRSPPRGC